MRTVGLWAEIPTQYHRNNNRTVNHATLSLSHTYSAILPQVQKLVLHVATGGVRTLSSKDGEEDSMIRDKVQSRTSHGVCYKALFRSVLPVSKGRYMTSCG
jgi:hypothetical protein